MLLQMFGRNKRKPKETKVNDKTLADAVVALGVGERRGTDYIIYDPHAADYMYLSHSAFTCSWLVAGPLMERVEEMEWYRDGKEGIYCVSVQPLGGSQLGLCSENYLLPRAITEACVEALNAD